MIPTPSSVLVVTPHPDDFEFGCAGIVAKWIKEGAKAVLVVATNGDKGTDDPEMTSEKLAAIRREEQLEAGRVLGLSEVVFPRLPGRRPGRYDGVSGQAGQEPSDSQA